MVYLRRVLIAVLSAGWIFPLFLAVGNLTGFVVLPHHGITSFPVVDFMGQWFGLALLWLGAVVVFWAWRLGGRVWWWAFALPCTAGLIPIWVSAQGVIAQVKAVFGNGGDFPVRFEGDTLPLIRATAQLLWVTGVWIVVAIILLTWRLSRPDAPAGSV